MLTSAILITVKNETTEIYIDRKIDNPNCIISIKCNTS